MPYPEYCPSGGGYRQRGAQFDRPQRGVLGTPSIDQTRYAPSPNDTDLPGVCYSHRFYLAVNLHIFSAFALSTPAP